MWTVHINLSGLVRGARRTGKKIFFPWKEMWPVCSVGSDPEHWRPRPARNSHSRRLTHGKQRVGAQKNTTHYPSRRRGPGSLLHIVSLCLATPSFNTHTRTLISSIQSGSFHSSYLCSWCLYWGGGGIHPPCLHCIQAWGFNWSVIEGFKLQVGVTLLRRPAEHLHFFLILRRVINAKMAMAEASTLSLTKVPRKPLQMTWLTRTPCFFTIEKWKQDHTEKWRCHPEPKMVLQWCQRRTISGSTKNFQTRVL